MADFINVHDPRSRLDADAWKHRAEREHLQLDLRLESQRLNLISERLEAIFCRIERGETVELHYEDGRIIIIGAVAHD